MSACSVCTVVSYFVFYLYFVFFLLPTWRIKPDDDEEEDVSVQLRLEKH